MSRSEFIETYGAVLYESFVQFMRGQTIGLTDDGEPLFYKHDIDNFFASDNERFWD